MLLSGKVAIITGVGPGLGQELAYAFAREGARIGICCRRTEELDRIAGECRARGAEVVAEAADVTDRDQRERLIRATVAAFGRLDILVNSAFNAGAFTLFEESDIDDWRGPLEVNLLGSLAMTQLALPFFKAAGAGSVVNVNSMIHRKPIPLQGAYATSKAALAGATKMLAAELGRYQVRVNSVCMGWMWGPPAEGFVEATATGRGVSKAAVVEEIAAAIPLGVIPDDSDCANAVVFMASDLARVITGATLDVNGGEFMP